MVPQVCIHECDPSAFITLCHFSAVFVDSFSEFAGMVALPHIRLGCAWLFEGSFDGQLDGPGIVLCLGGIVFGVHG